MSDSLYMMRALALAKKGIGFTSPNPAVGAVIVKNGKVIGEGYHRKAGEKHAEILAIKNVHLKSKIRNLKSCALYVTLEPCCHHGRTPPCTEAIVSAGIRHVIVGMIDPMKHTNKKGVQELRRCGVRVDVLNQKSVLVKEIRALNQPFLKWVTTGLPYVILKAGMSLDGKIATRTGESKWITGEAARNDARMERSRCDAVLVGVGTVFSDDPELSPQGPYTKKRLLRIIIDPELKAPLSKKVFRDANVFVATTDRAPAARRRQYENRGVGFHSFGKNRVSIPKLLAFLGRKNIQSVFVEGGSATHGAFYDARMVDKIIFYFAPKIIGGAQAVPSVGGVGAASLAQVLKLNDVQMEPIDENIKVRGLVRWY